MDDERVGGHLRQQSGDVPSLIALPRIRGTQSVRFDTFPEISGRLLDILLVFESKYQPREGFRVQRPIAAAQGLLGHDGSRVLIVVRELHPAIGKDQGRNLLRTDCRVSYRDCDRIVGGDHGEARQPRTLNYCLEITDHCVHRKIGSLAIGEARPSRVVPDQMKVLCERLIEMNGRFPYRLHVAEREKR